MSLPAFAGTVLMDSDVINVSSAPLSRPPRVAPCARKYSAALTAGLAFRLWKFLPACVPA